MEITVLAENSALTPDFEPEHGLSLFIKTGEKNILIDTGQSPLFIRNAEKSGVDLAAVDMVFISHGHYDHGGGLEAFLKINSRAEIFINENAFGDYYNAEGKYIGLDKSLEKCEKIHKMSGLSAVGEGVYIFSSVTGKRLYPFGNARLLKAKEQGGERIFTRDDFTHEQYIVIKENGKYFLFSGCAHRGIVNIMEEFVDVFGTFPAAAISGFHLMKNGEYTESEKELIEDTAREMMRFGRGYEGTAREMMRLGRDYEDTARKTIKADAGNNCAVNETAKSGTVYYTGHCTGDAMPLLKEIMGDRLVPVSTGEKLYL